MTSFTPVPPGAGPPADHLLTPAPLTEGPRWYRSRIRTWGPPVGLVVPGILGAIAYGALRFSDAAWSGAVGLIGGVCAAPFLLVVGAPFGERDLYALAIAASGLLWILVGFLASRRATRNPMATWSDYWHHFAWMCGGIWLGCCVALGIAALAISDSLF